MASPSQASEASTSDTDRLHELLRLSQTNRTFVAKNAKPSLEKAARDAGLGKDMFYPKESGSGKGPLKNSEYLIASILQREKRLSVVRQDWLTPHPSPAELKAANAAVLQAKAASDLPSVPPQDLEELDAVIPTRKYKSYRDNKDPWSYNVQKHASADKDAKLGPKGWQLLNEDPLAVIADRRAHPERYDGKEKECQLLVKDCLDIKHWIGYAKSSEADRRAYYTEWYPRFVVDSITGSALKDNALNRYQSWCWTVYGKVVPVTSCEMLHSFYKWFADEVEDIPEGYTMIRTSFPYISEMAYYHGYVSKTDWNDGHWVPGDFNHGFTVRKQTQQQVKASRSGTVQNSEDYWFSDRSSLTSEQLDKMSAQLMEIAACDCIPLQLYNSLSTQTLIRAKEMLQLKRMHCRLVPISSDYLSKFGPVQLMEIVSKGYNKKDKSGTLYSWVTRRLKAELTDPMFWSSVALLHHDQRMRQGDSTAHGSIVNVIQQRKTVELMQKSQYRPLERVRTTTRFVSSMLPLISGRGLLRTGTGPMRSVFHYLTPAELNKFSIKPALRKLKVAAIAVGKACGLYRQAAIQNLIQKGGVPRDNCKGLSKHVEKQSAMEGFYAVKCPGETMPLIIMAAGYMALPHQDFRWQSHYVQGRGLYPMETIQQKHPEVWQIISTELLPGLDDWFRAVEARGWDNLSKHEQMDAYQAQLQYEQRNIFLQDSAILFPLFPKSDVFLQLPIFRNKVFLDWLLGDFRTEILRLQSMAELAYATISAQFQGRTVLDQAREALGIDISATRAQSLQLLYKMCELIRQGVPIQSGIFPAAPPPVELPATSAGQPGVVAITTVNCLEQLWKSWEQGFLDCNPLRCYFADPPYPRDDRSVTMRWFRKDPMMKRWGSVKRMVLEMDKQVRKLTNSDGDSFNGGSRVRAANKVIRKWSDLLKQPLCDVETVAQLAAAFNDYSQPDNRAMLTYAQAKGNGKRDAEGKLINPSRKIDRSKFTLLFL